MVVLRVLVRAVCRLCGVAGLFSICVAAQAAGAPPMMATPGQMNVSGAGAFTYSVPIIVPPGTAGMGPALALDYSSQNGDGPEGIGWALTGMPAITRCPRTVAQDGIHGGVNFDANDRFCMEGQRLMLIAGTYGADGSEYRTEIDTYSRILAHGAAGNGPAWFEVHTKAGQIIELGNTADSRVLPVKADGSGTMPTARAWAVDKISDTKGNYLTVSYINDTVNGQVYPLSVHYTGNAAAGVSPYNSVLFVYGARTDMTPSYQAGAVMKTTVLLSDIETYSGANLVLDYKIGYTPAASAATHDELNAITQCDGGATQKCLPPISFAWQGSRDTLTYDAVPNHTAEWAGATTPPQASIMPGDFNGDGLTDYAVLVSPYWPQTCPPTQGSAFYFGTISGGFSAGASTISDGGTTSPLCVLKGNGAPGFNPSSTPVDFNGDGITDLFSTQLMDHLRVFVASGSGFAAGGTIGGAPILGISTPLPPAPAGMLGDFDGDGRTDVYPYLSNGDGTFRNGATIPPGGTAFNAADLDGDGCTDFISGIYPNITTFYYSCNPAVASFTTTALVYAPQNSSIAWTVGDFNGDGKTDVIDASGHLFLSTGTGLATTGFVAPSSWGVPPYTAVGDFNGDGKTDIAAPKPDGSGIGIYLSTGTGFVLGATIPFGIPVVADWNSDGAQDIWLQNPSNDIEYLFHYTPELMTGVSNGLGASTTVTYGKLNDPTVYTKGSGAAYPIQDMIGAQYVVSKVASSDGVGGTYASNYTYAGGKTDLSGRGFMGFAQVTVTDPQLHVAQTTNYRMDFPFTGEVVSRTKVWTPASGAPVTLSSVANTYQTDPTCQGGAQTAPPYTVELCSSVAQSSDTTGSAFPSVTTAYTYDTFGNALTASALVSDGSSKLTTNTYLNDTTNWFLGRLLTSSVQSTVGSSSLTRHSSYGYDPASGLVTAEIVEPQDTGALRLETDTQYDAFGNKHVVTATGLAAGAMGLASQSRPTTSTYDARGQFAVTVANALGESEAWSTNADYGTPASHTGPNGIATSWTYDSFGRVTKELRADGTATLYAYTYCAGTDGGTASCPANGAYLVTATPVAPDGVTPNGPIAIAYYDTLSRAIASDTSSFDGSSAPFIRSETQYDGFGHVVRASRPYFVGVDAPVWTVSSFVLNEANDNTDTDPLARAWSVTAPDASVTSFTYDALVTSVTNANHATTTTLKNAQGLIAQVTDANGQLTTYTYDAFGDLTVANPPGPAIVRYTYDLRGRKLTAADPDMGLWSYSYDAFGALASQTDAKAQTVTMAYDTLGRMVSRTEPDMVSAWTYGTSVTAHNIDKLTKATCSAGAGGNACGPSYARSYFFDSLARPSQLTVAVGGVNYKTTTAYDTITGKPSQVRAFSGFTVNYGYTAHGYLATVTDASAGTVYFTANARDASLELTQSTAGNGVVTTDSYDPLTGRMLNVCATHDAGTCDGAVTNISTSFDPVGNLIDRGDMLHDTSEVFTYDPLNRLTHYTVTGQGTNLSRAMRYNSAGSITEKSDVCAVNGCYAYTGAQPHAVSSITGTVNGIVNPTFAYDPNGNMTSGAGRVAQYTSFNMVSNVTEGTTSVGLLYDPEHARIQQTAPEGTTLYLNDPASGAMTEHLTATSGMVTWRNYITVDGKIVAERSTTGSSATVRYFVLDHLGSTVALTKEDGTLAESDAYDAWGKARNPTTGGDDTTCSLPSTQFSTRGYTGHEEMPDLCLVNMNARIYDPTIGRFMSPDDVIPDLYNGQNFNRYTYVDNNPLSYTDPTGHAETGNDYHPYTYEDAVRNNPDCTGQCDSDQDRAMEQGLENQAIAGALGAKIFATTGISASGITVAYAGGGVFFATVPGVTFANEDGSQTSSTLVFSEDMGQVIATHIKAGNANVGSGKFVSGNENEVTVATDTSPKKYDHAAGHPGIGIWGTTEQISRAQTALRRLESYGPAAEQIDKANDIGGMVTFRDGNPGSSGTDWGSGGHWIITWDSLDFAEVSPGVWRSPMMGLFHEIVHAGLWESLSEVNRMTPMAAYDNLEEYRVIKFYENPVANHFGESGERISHNFLGTWGKACDVTSAAMCGH
jgi:RHS repeat-associated protein